MITWSKLSKIGSVATPVFQQLARWFNFEVSHLPTSTAVLLPQNHDAFLFARYNLQSGRGMLLKGLEAPFQRGEGWVWRRVGKVTVTDFPAEGNEHPSTAGAFKIITFNQLNSSPSFFLGFVVFF